jgi:hypothetical protein
MAETPKTYTKDEVEGMLAEAQAEIERLNPLRKDDDDVIKTLTADLEAAREAAIKAGEPTPAVDSLYNAAAAKKLAAKREKALAAEVEKAA